MLLRCCSPLLTFGFSFLFAQIYKNHNEDELRATTITLGMKSAATKETKQCNELKKDKDGDQAIHRSINNDEDDG